MENSNSNPDSQHSESQQDVSTYTDAPPTISSTISPTRPSKHLKLDVDSTEDTTSPLPTDPYCPICDRTFRNLEGLQSHMVSSLKHKDLARILEDRKKSKQSEQTNESHSWTAIGESAQQSAFEALQARCHTHDDLQKRKYVVRPYTEEDCAGLTRCSNCRRLRRDLERRDDSRCTFHPGKRPFQGLVGGGRPYSCCGKPGEGCETSPTHTYGLPDPKYQEFAVTPGRSPTAPRRKAVALDCEMALVQTATVPFKVPELVLLCAVDYLTGETLVNSLVSPSREVLDWCTQYSGVTAHAMDQAKAHGQALQGWQEARPEMLKYIDADTILVGQSLENDLEVLRMIHMKVVDSACLTNMAVGLEVRHNWSLKVLCHDFLGIDIQTQGKEGHNCLEDTLAAREVVLWCCQNPEQLKEWARVKRKEYEEQERLRKEALEEAKKEKERVREGQHKIQEGLEIANGMASDVKQEGQRKGEVENKEPEKRQERLKEKRRRQRRRRQERKKKCLQPGLQHSVISSGPISSRDPLDACLNNDDEALKQPGSSSGAMICKDPTEGRPRNDDQSLQQSDTAEDVAAAFQPTPNKILDLIKAHPSKAFP